VASEPAARVAAHELRLARADGTRSYFHGLTMQPHLVEGDLVQTEPVTAAEVRLGDVVTYRFEDKFPTRRVVRRHEAAGTFTFMGDSIPGFRAYVVPYEDVLARVVGRERDGEWLAATGLRWRAQTSKVRLRLWLRWSPVVAVPRWLWGRLRGLTGPR
jgi:hypothetical protein